VWCYCKNDENRLTVKSNQQRNTCLLSQPSHTTEYSRSDTSEAGSRGDHKATTA